MRPRTQHCLRCHAALDVSNLEPGARFTCSQCGNTNMVDAVAPPVREREPRTPARRAPAARRPSGSRPPARGPQRAPPRRPRQPSRAPWGIAVGLLAIAAIVVIVAMGGDDDEGAQGPKAPRVGLEEPSEEERLAQRLAGLEREYLSAPQTTRGAFQYYIRQLKELGDDAKPLLQRVYREYVEGPGGDDAEARTALGHKAFNKEVPESVSYRGYEFIRAVEAARQHGWFRPEEKDAYEAALEAWDRTEAHIRRLREDAGYRAQDRVRANIQGMPQFGRYNYAARWAPPYLICYATNDVTSKFEVLATRDPQKRQRRLKQLEERRRRFEPILEEKALLFQQVYREFMGRFRKPLRLRDLTEPYGGRPDYPAGKRMFPDGVPLVVWIFSDRDTFNAHHIRSGQGRIADGVAGYFLPRTGWVYLFDEPDNRQFEINKNVHEAVHQLQYWFTRQRNQWAPPHFTQDFLGEGLAELLGAVRMDANRILEFQGVNPLRLENMRLIEKALRKHKRTYPLFPSAELASIGTYGDAAEYVVKHWSLPADIGIELFYQQSWAFTYFLDRYRDGKYRAALAKYIDKTLDNETSYFLRRKAFMEAFGIRDDDGFKRLDKEFETFFQYDIRTLDPKDWTYYPPGRYDWPR